MAKTATNTIEKRTGDTKAGKERKDKKAKEIIIIKLIKLLIIKSATAANSLLSKISKTFNLSSFLKALGVGSDLSSLFMLGNVVAPSATIAKRIAKKANSNRDNIANNTAAAANKRFINKNNLIIISQNKDKLSKDKLHKDKQHATTLNQNRKLQFSTTTTNTNNTNKNSTIAIQADKADNSAKGKFNSQ